MFKFIAATICLFSISAQAVASKMTTDEENTYINKLKEQYRTQQLVDLPAVEYADAYVSTVTISDLNDQLNGQTIDRLSRIDVQAMRSCINKSNCELYEIFVATVGFVQDTGTSFFVTLDLEKRTHDLIVQKIYAD